MRDLFVSIMRKILVKPRSGKANGFCALFQVLLLFSAPLFFSSCAGDARVTIRGEKTKTFQVELVEGRIRKTLGLMFRSHLERDRGMLFVYETPAYRSFWMKNTRVPLDIIFVDEHMKVLNVEAADPCEADPCPRYVSSGRAKYVLEVGQGFSREYGFGPGAEVEIDTTPP